MEKRFLRGALFSGMTSGAFKLGTVLSLGWFWMRTDGCCALYRGESIDRMDFDNILVTGAADCEQIAVPDYLAHNNGTDYFYVLRMINGCGQQEYTQSASVKVSIDADGDIAKSEPNCVYSVSAEQVSFDAVRLLWFYCPLEQREKISRFKIYSDGGTGQIDYESAPDVIDYKGRRFYSCRVDSLDEGKYLFAVRAESEDGIDDGSFAVVEVELKTNLPCEARILGIEVI